MTKTDEQTALANVAELAAKVKMALDVIEAEDFDEENADILDQLPDM